MSKNKVNNQLDSKINNGKIVNNNSSNNKITDNSITKNNNKIISKDKNAKKKNRNILPPQEKPTFENGQFKNIIDENFYNLRKKPEIKDISFIRPNLQLLYEQGRSLEMFAYVTAYRNKDNKYVLYNLCSESLFLADHVIVKPDEDNILSLKVGQCIRFTGTATKYGDKNSVIVENIKDIGISKPPELKFEDKCPDDDDIEDVFMFISDCEPTKKYEMVRYLVTKLEGYSLQLFRNKKFILAMICDFYFMRTINSDLSNNRFYNILDRTKERFIMLLSDIIYGIETGNLKGFKDIQNRILTICIMIQGLPEKNVLKTFNSAFESFIDDYNIDRNHAARYIKDIYKWYDIDHVKEVNPYNLNKEMRYATASIILNS